MDAATASGDVQSTLQAIGTVVDGLITVQQNTSDTLVAAQLRNIVQDALLSTLNSTSNTSVQVSTASFSAYASQGTPAEVLSQAGIDVPSSIATEAGTDITNNKYAIRS